MKRLLFPVLWLIALPLCAQQQARIAPGAEAQLSALLNKAAAVKPSRAAALGKGWFNVEFDSHVFTDQASLRQVAAVLWDFDKQETYFSGKKIKLSAAVVSRQNDALTVDFNSNTPVLGIRFLMPYRATVKILENTDTKFVFEIRQTAQDSETNTKTRNLYSIRYAEEITVNGKKYIYIRAYNKNDVNAHLNFSGVKNTVEKNSDATNEETLDMAVEAARTITVKG
jgi:hypothetical protein